MHTTRSKEEIVRKKTMCSIVISFNRRNVLNFEFCYISCTAFQLAKSWLVANLNFDEVNYWKNIYIHFLNVPTKKKITYSMGYASNCNHFENVSQKQTRPILLILDKSRAISLVFGDI